MPTLGNDYKQTRKVIETALEVDAICSDTFRQEARDKTIQPPESITIQPSKLTAFYGLEKIDGRVLFSKFLDLLERSDFSPVIDRPKLLDDSSCLSAAHSGLGRMNQAEMASGTPMTSDYASGKITVRHDDEPLAYVTGANPKSSSFSIRLVDSELDFERFVTEDLGWKA